MGACGGFEGVAGAWLTEERERCGGLVPGAVQVVQEAVEDHGAGWRLGGTERLSTAGRPGRGGGAVNGLERSGLHAGTGACGGPGCRPGTGSGKSDFADRGDGSGGQRRVGVGVGLCGVVRRGDIYDAACGRTNWTLNCPGN